MGIGPDLERMVYAGGLGLAVGGLTRRHQVQSIQHSMQHSVLCLFQVGLTVLGRPNDRGVGGVPGRTGGTPIPTWREWYSRAVWG